MTEIKWANNLKKLGGNALSGSSLTNVEIPDGVTDIGTRCFQSCNKLQTVKIPNSVSTIGAQCFSFCNQLQTVKIPNSVTTIGSGCFQNSPNLTVEIDKKKDTIDGSPWGHINGDRGIKWLR